MLRAMSRLAAVLLVLVLAACSSPRTSTHTSHDAPLRFEDLATRVTTHLYGLDPAEAVGNGLHEYDGMLPDRSPAMLANVTAQLQKDRDNLSAATGLTPLQTIERDVLLQEVRGALFRLVDADAYRTNPLAYSGAINLDAYILRDYAPAVERAGAIIKLCRGLGAYLATARQNLRLPMPRPWIDTALLQTRGYIEFADKDVRGELARIGIPLANQAEIDPALDACKAALVEHAAWLEQQQPHGTTAYALGEARFMKMLADTQSIDTTLAALTTIAEEDLARNSAAMIEAARAIDPKRPTAAVVAELSEIKPPASEILALATQQATTMRAFVIANKIATIPSENVAEVRETPAFQRWNAASLSSPGPFEKKALPSFYYISPPDPKWPPAEQRAYIMPPDDLLMVTIHELWPGHFLHGLHIRKNPSKILQSFCTYTTSEGWAHYTEEMMLDAGAVGRTPQARIGMLKEALLRNVRFVVALGEHAHGMTVEQATKLFQDKAFVDPGNARQQAVRGTFDPMFLSYTLGKVMIQKLRDTWLAQNPGAKLGDFHDALLSYGCAPLPVISPAMLAAAPR